jgi:hypothetical protein
MTLGVDRWDLPNRVCRGTVCGEEDRQYKLELYMTEPDYRQVVAYYAERAIYYARMAHKYAERGEKRYHVKIPVQFHLFGDAA